MTPAPAADFRVLDLTDIRTFGGRAAWFYDGAHVTTENAHADRPLTPLPRARVLPLNYRAGRITLVG